MTSGAAVEITVTHEHGLHLRPAAQFVRLAARYRADILVSNLARGGRSANAKSVLEVTALGVDQGHLIRLEASGNDADAAVEALEDLVQSGFRKE